MYNPLFRYILNNQIIAALLLIATAYFLWLVRDILVAVFLSFIIMASLYPLSKRLTNKGIPKILSIIIVYLSVLAVITVLVLPLLPFFVSQVQLFIQNLPLYIKDSSRILGFEITLSQINSYINPSLDSLTQNVFSVTGRVFGGLFTVVMVIIVSFYLMIYHDKLGKFVSAFFPRKLEETAVDVLQKIEDKLGAWLRGQILLSLSVGAATWIALTILGIPFALPLALIAGILEIVPTVGPIIAAVPAVIIAFTISPTTAILTVVAYMIIQLLENNILVPKIMQRSVGLNPIVVIIAILMGAKLMGIIGALLAIPFLSVLIIIYRAIRHYQI